jgi:hypothetical protein
MVMVEKRSHSAARVDHLTPSASNGGVLHAIVLNQTSDSLAHLYIRRHQGPVVSARLRIDGARDVSLRVG